MGEEYKPRTHQQEIYDFLQGGAESLVLVEMGLGKTVAVLTYMNDVISEDLAAGHVRRFLVFAPNRVARNVWPAETAKWDHLTAIRMGVCTGKLTPDRRRRMLIDPKFNVVVANYETMTWLCDTFPPGKFPFYGLVLDEIDFMKHPDSKRFDKFRYRAHEFDVRVGMTGTFTPESLLNAFGPAYLISSHPFHEGRVGKKIPMKSAVGSSYEAFKRKWFIPDFNGYRWDPAPGAVEGVTSLIEPFTYQALARDYVNLPDLIVQDVRFELPADVHKAYKKLEADFVLELERSGGELDFENWDVVVADMLSDDDETRVVETPSPATLYGKLRQLCSGFLYSYRPMTDEELAATRARGGEIKPVRETSWIHTAKLKAYQEVVDGMLGAQLVAVYGYQAEVERLGFEHCLSSKLSDTAEEELLQAWTDGAVKVLAIHPKSAGHGLNLHDGGAHHMVYITLPASAGAYAQTNARLLRMGQKHPVIVHRLVAANTIEEDVIAALAAKSSVQEHVVQAIKRRVND